MSNTKITSHVIESGAVHTTHIASGAISAAHLTGVTTANITENTNLYYTDTRARASISVTGGNLSYDNLTGVIQLTDSEIRDAISATSSGDGSLTYTAGTGVIAYTGPTASEVQAHLSAGTGVTYSGGQISIGQAVGTGDTVSFGNITTAGYLRGPANFTIDPAAYGDDTGTLIIAGNLQVDGTTTTINSTTLTVDDLNLTLASGAANAAAANGAGITVDGASATLLYASTGDKFVFNKGLDVTGAITGSIAASNINSGRLTDARMPTTIGASASTNFIGTFTGNANTASNTPVYGTGSNATHYITFASSNGGGSSDGTGSQARLSDGGLTYNPSTNALGVSGNISVGGTVDGVDIAARDAVLTSTTTTANAALPKAGGTMTGDLAMGSNVLTSVATNNFEIDITGSLAGNIRANADFFLLSQTGTLNLGAGGTNSQLKILANGNVGIGTSSPSVTLEVIDPVSGNFAGAISVGGTGSGRRLILEQTDVLTYRMGGTGTNSITQLVSAGSAGTGTVAMTIDESQNVGIGTTSPGAKLTVKNSANWGESAVLLADTDAEGPAFLSLQKYPATQAAGGAVQMGNGDYIGGVIMKGFTNSGTNSKNYIEIWGRAMNVAHGSESSMLNIGTFASGTEHAHTLVAREGKVGVGLVAPASRLHVVSGVSRSQGGSVRINRHDNNGGLFLHSDAQSSHYNWMITTQDTVDEGIEFIPSTAVGGTTFSSPAMSIVASTGEMRAKSILLENTAPIRFIANGSENTYMRSVIYAHQNNTGSNFNNGMHIEMGRISNSSTAEVRAFVVGARGGQSSFKVTERAAGVTQADGDYLVKMYDLNADGFIDLCTGQATPLVKTRITSYGTNYFTPAGTTATNMAAVSIGSNNGARAGILNVDSTGTSTAGGIRHRMSAGTQYLNVASTQTGSGTIPYWHIKTNIYYNQNVMFVARVHGYAYGNSGHIIDMQRSGYAYSGSSTALVGSQFVNNGSSTVDSLVPYYTSAGQLCFRAYAGASSYYTGMAFDIKMQSPTGYNHDFVVDTHHMNATSGNYYT